MLRCSPNKKKAGNCEDEHKICRKDCRLIHSDCSETCLESFYSQCHIDCDASFQSVKDDCDFENDVCLADCRIGDWNCEKQPTCGDRCLAKMEDGFDVCDAEYDECLTLCTTTSSSSPSSSSSSSSSSLVCLNKCSEERQMCKGGVRTEQMACDLRCGAKEEEECFFLCERALLNCMDEASEQFDICSYKCSRDGENVNKEEQEKMNEKKENNSSTSASSSSSSAFSKTQPKSISSLSPTSDSCQRECSANLRQQNSQCNRINGECIILCSSSTISCKEKCLTDLDTCFLEADKRLRNCKTKCKQITSFSPASSMPNSSSSTYSSSSSSSSSLAVCEKQCQFDHRKDKERCRDKNYECTDVCETKEKATCKDDCESFFTLSFSQCDKALDECTFSHRPLSSCLSQRRICEAKAKDSEEECLSKCDTSVDEMKEKCEFSFERDLDRCEFSHEECLSLCISPGDERECSSECNQQSRLCKQSAEEKKRECDEEAKKKWAERCSQQCEGEYMSCLDSSEERQQKCVSEECSEEKRKEKNQTNAVCVRGCRAEQRKHESECIKQLDLCSAQCPVME
ncbi:uncharacterized protein MONOS_8204 [Monocercomonoides exilis]|uniref:uncharacterized protein n=1 Tax=Monocercomonoides exilis TaxID=2049356 RepID=UPI003559CA24|nr:hypothetical protein MONOS_8204 [Monocercomonoides exilis]|eukprot:MONOS_8204.1-p1 / transcript=MONOS_8204.1 / gene=MONOS_8204 / organism=Monocercomonoides_exilis_PA203 / gene_product=unspecified product / transcript_product=unspecified product / location=Mono_scaffold00303:15090-17689(-) / protein_length=572 / sequence_SO=supercontig / SO=protein_coding / is_pseudo=false